MDDVLGKIKRKLLRKYPAWGSVTANLEFVIDDRVYSNGMPTCGTDGKRVAFHSEYVASASEEKLLYAGAHEVGHVAFNHIYRSEGKNPKLWNIACDAVLNQLLKTDGIEIPEGSIDYEDAIDCNVEEYYEKLLKQDQEQEKDQQEEKSNEQGQSSSNSGEESNNDFDNSEEQKHSNSSNQSSGQQESDNMDVGHDTHSMWDDAIKEKNEQDKQMGESKEEASKQDDKPIDEKKAFEDNAMTRKQQLDELMKELSKTASNLGTTTKSDLINLNDIGVSKPLVDWRYVLKEALQLDVDWSYQNAEIEYGVITPQLESYPQPETEIVLDTSGSISETLLKNFLRECKSILQTSKVKVGCFDTRFYGFNEIRTEEDIENMEHVGGGGTDFDVAVGAFTKRVENKIIFTDGDASMPSEQIDAIWIVFGGKKIKPNGGRVIEITEEQLQRLYYMEQEPPSRGMKR